MTLIDSSWPGGRSSSPFEVLQEFQEEQLSTTDSECACQACRRFMAFQRLSVRIAWLEEKNAKGKKAQLHKDSIARRSHGSRVWRLGACQGMGPKLGPKASRAQDSGLPDMLRAVNDSQWQAPCGDVLSPPSPALAQEGHYRRIPRSFKVIHGGKHV